MQLPWFLDEWDSLFWQKVAGFASGIIITYFVMHRVWKRRKIHQKIQKKRDAVQESCQRLMERLRTEGLSVARRDQILALPTSELHSQLQTGKLKAMDVLRAYQSKAMEAHDKVNCIVEPILEAETQAAELDAQTGRKGPLHGIPVSIKEAFVMKGYDCTGGYQYFINKPKPEDGVFVKILKEQGAIPFVRTNIPQTMFTFDSSNPIFGQTKNPHDHTRSPGGSSSGEGALIGSGGSCLGLGNDIGGSIRIPAHMCGVCGLKPTVERLGTGGMFDVGSGQNIIPVAAGPLGRDVESLVLCFKGLLVPALNKAWPQVQVTPFDTQVYSNKDPLRIGYFTDNGVLPAVPSVERGVEVACHTLLRKGHTLVKFEPPKVKYMFTELFVNILLAEEIKEINSLLKNDILDPCWKLNYYAMSIPYPVRWILSYIVQLVDTDLANGFRMKIGGVSEWYKLAEKLQAYKLEFIAEMKKQKLDAIICPTLPLPAIPLGQAAFITAAASYTALFNALNFPAGCLPVTKVTSDDQSRLKDSYPTRQLSEKMAKKMSAGTEGLPVSVQCAALPFQEELVLRVMKDIQDGVGYVHN